MKRIKKSLKGMQRFAFLRKEYPVFTYQKYEWSIKGQKLDLRFYFSCGDIQFSPSSSIKIPKSIELVKWAKPRKKLLDNLVFHKMKWLDHFQHKR